MKESKYNFIIEGKDGNTLFYNTRMGSLAVVEPHKKQQYDLFIRDEAELDNDFLSQLKYCGFLVEDGFDEKLDIKMRLLSSRYDTSVLSLTITPTMACNFRCVYCFENGHYGHGKMSISVQDKIAELVEKEVHHIEKLVITWYGGEPLLAMDVIELLTPRLKKICDKHHVEYSASMITNGYLLNTDMCKRLDKCHVGDVQITLDADCNTHNKRRPLADGAGSYEKIISNLEEVHGKIGISIRINVDKLNKDKVQEVVNELKERNIYKDVFCYLGLVTSANGQCDNCTCMTSEMYSKFNLEFMFNNEIPLQSFYPKPSGNYCGADYVLGYVIDADGYVYKCWSDVGISERCIMTLDEMLGHNVSENNLITDTQSQLVMNGYMLFDPTEDNKCSECKYLPICMGGCPHSRLENNQICEQYRYNIDGFLLEYARKITDKEN